MRGLMGVGLCDRISAQTKRPVTILVHTLVYSFFHVCLFFRFPKITIMHKSIFLFLTLSLFAIEGILAQDFDNIISTTADTLAKKIISSQRKTVAITDFINLDESITQLGTFLSEEVSSELSNLTGNQTKFRILERSKLDEIFKEKKLMQSTDGGKLATELGKLDVADVLVFATITDFNGYYRVVMKLLDTKTGDALSSVKVSFVKTPSLENLNANIVKQKKQSEIMMTSPLPVNTTTTSIPQPKSEVKTYNPNAACEKNNTGDVCLLNKSSYAIRIDMLDEKTADEKAYFGYTTPKMTLEPNEKGCFYNISAKQHSLTYQYVETQDHHTDGGGYGGNNKTKQVNIKKCATEGDIKPIELR